MSGHFQKIKSISQYHQFMGLPSPEHPLISVIDFTQVVLTKSESPISYIFDFYAITLKENFKGKMKYGQKEYDFDEGVLSFIAPGQVFSFEMNAPQQPTGFIILIHPDFFWGTALANAGNKYEFFQYTTNEALFLSDKEKRILFNLKDIIHEEYLSNIDTFSQDIIISQLELLLNYSNRFYKRQFITRNRLNVDIQQKLESYLETYFNRHDALKNGLPTVQQLADQVNLSPSYLGDMLRALTGRNAQQLIHDKLIEKSKELLSTTNLSVSEIAFQLGFDYSQSFSRLFKSKMDISPMEFRKSFQ